MSPESDQPAAAEQISLEAMAASSAEQPEAAATDDAELVCTPGMTAGVLLASAVFLLTALGMTVALSLIDDPVPTYQRAAFTKAERMHTSPQELSILWYKAGYYAARKGLLAEAEVAYRKAVELEPQSGIALAALGTTFARRGAYGAARKLYAMAAAAGYTSFKLDYNRGLLCSMVADFRCALQSFSLALKKNPLATAALYNLAVILILQGREQEGQSLLRQALRGNPNYVKAATLLQRRTSLSQEQPVRGTEPGALQFKQ